MTALHFTVLGNPAPQGSKSAVVRANTVQILEGRTTAQREKFTAWRSDVASAAWVAMTRAKRIVPFQGPVAVEVLFRLHRPKSAKETHRWQWKRPDADKLARAVLDALVTGGVIADDAQVADLWARKVMAAPGEPLGCDVTIRALDPADGPAPSGEHSEAAS